MELEEPVAIPSNRSFGLVFVGFCAVVACWRFIHGQSHVWVFVAIAALLLAISLFRPALLAPFNRLWFRFGLLLNRIVSPVLMAVIFFCVVLPTGLVIRATQKDPLKLKWDQAAPSYWISRIPPGPTPVSIRNQF